MSETKSRTAKRDPVVIPAQAEHEPPATLPREPRAKPTVPAVADGTSDFLTRLALSPEMKPENLAAAIDGWIRVQEYVQLRHDMAQRQTALEAYIAAKAALQAEMRAVERGTVNPHTRSRFANLGDLWSACAPVWGRHGFAVDFDVTERNGEIEVTGFLSHAGGHVQTFNSYSAPPDTTGMKGGGNKTLIQGKQSTATYIQRNLLCRMVGIATVDDPADDDGAGTAASGRPPPRPRESDNPMDRLARGEPDAVATLVRDIERQPSTAALNTLVDQVRDAVDDAPEHVQVQIREALLAARARLHREQPKPAFAFTLIDAYGDTTGEVLGLDSWIDDFLELWDQAAKKPDEQVALREHNADALEAARPLHCVRLTDVFARDAKPAAALPHQTHAWIDEQLAAIAQLTRGPEAVATLLARVRDITPKMRELERTHPDAHKAVKAAFEAKLAAIKPESEHEH